MSAAGPDLPPHLLAKRKRKLEEDANTEATADSGARRSPSPDGADKRRKVLGPAMPPAALDEKPTNPLNGLQPAAEDSDESDDDDFGPSLPKAGTDVRILGYARAISDDETDYVHRLMLKTTTMTLAPQQSKHRLLKRS